MWQFIRAKFRKCYYTENRNVIAFFTNESHRDAGLESVELVKEFQDEVVDDRLVWYLSNHAVETG
jgi:hypothetical protein